MSVLFHTGRASRLAGLAGLAVAIGGCTTELMFSSQPPGATARVDSWNLEMQTGEVIELDEQFFGNNEFSRIDVDISLEGHRTLTVKNFVVNKGTMNRAPLAVLDPLNTTLELNTQPSGATIVFNLPEFSDSPGSRMLPRTWTQKVSTPTKLTCTHGEAEDLRRWGLTMQVQKQGYVPAPGFSGALPVDLIAGGESRMDVPLEDMTITLKVSTEPEGASVEDFSEGGFGYLGETPLTRQFTADEITRWAQQRNLDRFSVQAIELQLKIFKPGYRTKVRKEVIPVTQERSFKETLLTLVTRFSFTSDPSGASVYVERQTIEDRIDEETKTAVSVKVDFSKPLGTTPFELPVDQNDPLKHGEWLVFSKSNHVDKRLVFVVGQNSFHAVLDSKK